NSEDKPILKKKFNEEKDIVKTYPPINSLKKDIDKLEELSKKEEELREIIQENEKRLAGLLREKEALIGKPKKEAVLREKACELRDKAYNCLIMDDKIDKAIKLYQQAIKLDPKYPTPHNDLGIIYEERGLLEKAAEEYKKAIELDPNYAAGYSNLALLYEKQAKLSEALPYWKKRADLGNPDDPWTKRAKEKLNEYKKAGMD
ncbi:MAG: tetratricopeptide repeat protein, partial [Candidatus Omnitrophica bacterium]|nr:tetratricopeptide repeat protein [Candidatus Omnitrophota bacterium]